MFDNFLFVADTYMIDNKVLKLYKYEETHRRRI